MITAFNRFPFFAAMIFASSARSADKSTAVPTWNQEPDTAIGIFIGKPLVPIARCPDDYTVPNSLCRADSIVDKSFVPLKGLPWRDLRISGSVWLMDDRVESINFTLNEGDFEKFRAILVERYGSPTADTTQSVTSNGGVTLPSRSLLWSGKRVTITYIQRSGSIDQSIASISDNALVAEHGRLLEEKKKADASKF